MTTTEMDPLFSNFIGAETSLQNLMKEIGEAVEFDNESEDKVAYLKYSSCIYKISSNLMLNIKISKCNFSVTPSVSRQVKLLQLCVERVSSLLERIDKNQTSDQPVATCNKSGTQTAAVASQSLSNTDIVPNKAVDSARSKSFSNVQYVTCEPVPQKLSQDRNESGTPSVPIHMPVPSLLPGNNPHVYNKAPVISPLERAHARNKSLIIAYKARMKRLNQSNNYAYNYSLTLQRKMAENLAIAKAQEEELAKKMKARQERLEGEASRRFSQHSGMSVEEKELKEMYKNVLDYENDVEWLSKWRQKMTTNCEDPVLICQLLQEILRCSDHPITKLLCKLQFKVYEKLYSLVVNKHSDIDLIKIDLPRHVWPSAEEVSDILSAFKRTVPVPEVRKRKRIKSKGENSETSKMDSSSSEDVNKTEMDEKKTMKDLKEEINNSKEYESSDERHEITEKDGGNSSESQDRECDNRMIRKVIENENSDKESRTEISHSSIANAEEEVFVSSETDTDSCNEGDGEDDLKGDIVSSGLYTQAQLRHAYAENKKLSSELTIQRQQARLLMEQIYNGHFDDENFDDLFDDEDEDGSDNYDVDKEENKKKSNQGTQPVPAEKWKNRISFREDTNTTLKNKGDDGHEIVYHRKNSQISSDIRLQDQVEENCLSLPMSANTSEESSTLKGEEKQQVLKLTVEAYDRHLEGICKEVHFSLDKLLNVMIVAYEALDSPVGKDQCAVALEEPFFKPIWKALLRLFRVVSRKRELVLACVMTVYKEATLEMMKVSPKFSLPGREKPYQEAIDELLKLQEYYTIPSKLDCVVKVCRLICECVDKFYSSESRKSEESCATVKKASPVLGADDLLPVLTYVILHSQCPQLISECQAMAEFIAEGYMMGEEGYCLTTFRTAVEFLLSLYTPPSAEEIEN